MITIDKNNAPAPNSAWGTFMDEGPRLGVYVYMSSKYPHITHRYYTAGQLIRRSAVKGNYWIMIGVVR